ncbi:YrvL family regulatory protein [Priestia megaterium]|uniref:YrvL family regulatory protein n=1 Tax=Priestia megaterium TaxID=1404 RepID=UPI001EDA260D|nr:YrvL family regulatory protein [Priestia megaterium]
MLLFFTFFEYIILKVLGLNYDSVRSLILFFILYGCLEIPLNLVLSSLLKALKSLKILNSSKGILALVLNIASTFILINLIDAFMESISISQLGVLIFSLITGSIGWLAIQDEKEPPNRGSEEYNELEEKMKKF